MKLRLKLSSKLATVTYWPSCKIFLWSFFELVAWATKLYRPLPQLVISKASNVDIWSAVLNPSWLSLTAYPAKQHCCIVWRHTASLQNDERFYEIRECTYWNGGGFFKKYFDGKEGTWENKNIYMVLKKRYVRGQWKAFPNPPTQKEGWKRLSGFQEKSLSSTRTAYYTSEECSDFISAKAKGQVDFFGETEEWRGRYGGTISNRLEFPAAHRFRKGISSAVTSFSLSKSKPARSFGAFRHLSITKNTSEKRRPTTPDNKGTKRSRLSGQKPFTELIRTWSNGTCQRCRNHEFVWFRQGRVSQPFPRMFSHFTNRTSAQRFRNYWRTFDRASSFNQNTALCA